MANRTNYAGPERRIHKVYVTRNTEYHVRGGVCVAVKPRQDAGWTAEHGAVKMKLEGHVKLGTLLPMPGPPKIGFRMYFARGEEDILTSPVVAIVRPPKKIVEQYPHD
ncbi:MAG: hypothetical protein CVU63_13455 [Deltaproteobacteria bacterium HGW-Deltaproteobacteria-20]|jgi:hypothetical protein|nr:MAG: hypothetical protein CVU63_13455 [Deltaproteobacteria bacterium HGW-Deltaproteobacteria-20]